MDVDAKLLDARYLLVQDLLGQPVSRDAEFQFAAKPVVCFVDAHFMAGQRQLPGGREPAGTGPDNGHFFPGRLGFLGRRQVQAETTERLDIERLVDQPPSAGFHAQVRADLPADAARKWAVLQNELHGFFVFVLPYEARPLLRRNARWAGSGAWRQVFVVVPDWLEAAQLSSGRILDDGLVVIEIRAEDTTLTDVFFPIVKAPVGQIGAGRYRPLLFLLWG